MLQKKFLNLDSKRSITPSPSYEVRGNLGNSTSFYLIIQAALSGA
jgi:hypothetical protein